MGTKKMTREQWLAEATSRFGEDMMRWRFVCPCCGHVAAVQDWKDAGAPEGAVAFSCVGRWTSDEARGAFEGEGQGPCNYAGGGLFKLNPVVVVASDGSEHDVFDFAEA